MCAMTAHSVQVTRNGNSRTLSIPSAILDQEQIEVGELFVVETHPDGLFYRRVAAAPGWRMVGEGQDRYVVVDAAGVSAVEADCAPRPALDWDY